MAEHADPTEEMERVIEDMRQELQTAQDYVIHDMFGGPNMYRLLAQRNPEIKLLVQSGIIAGLRASEGAYRRSSSWQEAAWRMFQQLE